MGVSPPIGIGTFKRRTPEANGTGRRGKSRGRVSTKGDEGAASFAIITEVVTASSRPVHPKTRERGKKAAAHQAAEAGVSENVEEAEDT